MAETPQRLLPVSAQTTDGRNAAILELGEHPVQTQGRSGGRAQSGALVVAIPRGFLWGSLGALTLFLAAALVWGQSQGIHFRSQMTVEEFKRCGLAKLAPEELASLEAWIARRLAGRKTVSPEPVVAPGPLAPSPAGLGSALAPAPSEMVSDPLVAFNVSTHKYHCPRCRYALQCTRNCVEIPRSQALARGGVACGWCGGECR